MGALRLFTSIMGRISTFRSYQIVLLLAAALAVVAFYYFGSEKQNFSSTTKRIKQTQASHNANRNDADLSLDTRLLHADEQAGAPGEVDDARARRTQSQNGAMQRYHALMMFTKVDKNRGLQAKFQVAMRSMAKHGRFLEEELLVLHFVSDEPSRELGKQLLPELLLDASFKYEVVFHDEAALTEKLFPIVEAMQKHFSAGSGAYYSDSIFFLSVAMHRIMPADMKRIVQLDLDLKFRCNIRDLFQEFNQFKPEAVIGIAQEMQPVYRDSVMAAHVLEPINAAPCSGISVHCLQSRGCVVLCLLSLGVVCTSCPVSLLYERNGTVEVGWGYKSMREGINKGKIVLESCASSLCSEASLPSFSPHSSSLLITPSLPLECCLMNLEVLVLAPACCLHRMCLFRVEFGTDLG
ncbi:hypothetical protein ACEWY4_014941 [Coilia grayii]|uniref:Xyloside xylosyltransferase 1 n=1 Tax=Coilia grayii TaxID=363190 RepID=A0ABD1JTR5_9TELE